MRSGTLHKTEEGWIVRWSDLHQYGVGWHMMDTIISEKENLENFKEDDNVNFKIITLYYNDSTFQPIFRAINLVAIH